MSTDVQNSSVSWGNLSIFPIQYWKWLLARFTDFIFRKDAHVCLLIITSTPFKLNFHVTLQKIFLVWMMEKLSDVCVWVKNGKPKKCCWLEGSGWCASWVRWQKIGKGHFTHPEICDYVALHHKVSTESDFEKWKGSELTILLLLLLCGGEWRHISSNFSPRWSFC